MILIIIIIITIMMIIIIIMTIMIIIITIMIIGLLKKIIISNLPARKQNKNVKIRNEIISHIPE